MDSVWNRLAVALLGGFVSFLIALPVSCGGLLLYSEHLNGDVQSAGPQVLLGGMALAAVLGCLVVVALMIATGRRG